ncbi:STE family protein kinase [Tritrichomonas foetus]|uniref:STE family protein kinase n=1 Tax=Tritrichomonas foetus TaxID=1144522 RepID=A0A1J4L171_9EUKA|nr:STE family protein kinase [Tritrichomonas foetus]|eukprot:OHT15710.1 STE family protein kinase [Tritrichomonas foetus]
MSNSFPLEYAQYEILHKIGCSSYADVVVARCIPRNKLVAIKQIDLEICPLNLSQLANEVAFWASMSHANAILYHGSFTVGSQLWFLTEYVDCGSLKDILYEFFPNGIKNENIIATILQKVLLFLDYFHSHQQIHRDLQTKNILVSMTGEVKIGGFWNASTLIQQGQRKRARKTVLDLSCYAAPEAIVDTEKGYKQEADIWSLGIIAVEIATGMLPYKDMNPVDQITAVTQQPPPTLPDSFSLSFRDFVQECLVTNPEKRASAHHLLKHKFMHQAKNEAFLENTFTAQLPPLIQRMEMKEKNKEDAVMKEAQNFRKEIEFDFDVDCPKKSKKKHHKKDSENDVKTPPQPTESTTVTRKGRFILSVQGGPRDASITTPPPIPGNNMK